MEEEEPQVTAILHLTGDNGSLFDKDLPTISDGKLKLSLAF
jgi:hypothetical protein